MAQRLTRWLIFGVILSILPLIINVLLAATRDSVTPALQIICSRGELLLVCAGIAGAGIGEVVARGTNVQEILKIIAVGGCVIVLFVGLIWYASIVTYVESARTINLNVVTDGSLAIFGATFICAGGCIALSEL